MGCSSSSPASELPSGSRKNALIKDHKQAVSFALESFKTKFKKTKAELLKLSQSGLLTNEDICHLMSSDSGVGLPQYREKFRVAKTEPREFFYGLTAEKLTTDFGITNEEHVAHILSVIGKMNAEAALKTFEFAEFKALRTLNQAMEGYEEPLFEYISAEYIRDLLESAAENYKKEYSDSTKKKPKLEEVSTHKMKVIKAFIENFEEEKQNADPYLFAQNLLANIKGNKAQVQYFQLLGIDDEALKSLLDAMAKVAIGVAKPYILKNLNSFVDYLKRPVGYEEMKKAGNEAEVILKRELEEKLRDAVKDALPGIVKFTVANLNVELDS